jgi:hypothetical protein
LAGCECKGCVGNVALSLLTACEISGQLNRRPRPPSLLGQPRLTEVVEHGREIRRVFHNPFDRDCAIKAAGFSQCGFGLGGGAAVPMSLPKQTFVYSAVRPPETFVVWIALDCCRPKLSTAPIPGVVRREDVRVAPCASKPQ